jgi:hypothetical protein
MQAVRGIKEWGAQHTYVFEHRNDENDEVMGSILQVHED